jgi:signal transduction histidine kinase
MTIIEEKQQRPSPTPIRADSLQRLLEISTRLSSTLQLDALLDLVMDVATELTHTEAASILLVDQKTGQLHFAASTGSQMPKDIIVPLDSSIAGWVVRTGRSLVLADVQADDRFYATVDEDLAFHTRSMLAVPLVTAKGIIGCLEVINKIDNSAYTPQDMAIMEALASQSAVAILNAHLFHQSDLLAEIMHELKTPLMAITTASELLARPDFPAEKQAEVVHMIQRESGRLSRMTKEFVDFARLESGRMQLARRPVAIEEVVYDVLRLSQAQADARRIGLTAVCQPTLPATTDSPCVIGDQDRLKQVLLNLVSNGIKYNRGKRPSHHRRRL